MIKYILTPLLLVLCTVVCGQGITHYQYWFDGDVDSRVTTATSGNVDVQVDVTALPDGVHTIHYRAVDDQGRWTAPECYYFIKHKPLKQTQRTPATLTKYEYWFDNDIANRIVTENTNGIVDIQTDITTLTDGVHTINYRMADSYGSWTPPESYYFIKHKPLKQTQRTPATLTKYEYWFDNDIANRIVTENTSGIVDIQTDITALTDGVHTINYRMADSYGSWTPPESYYFIKYKLRPAVVDNRKIRGYRYWFNDAESQAEYVELSEPVNPYEMNEVLTVNNLVTTVTRDNYVLTEDDKIAVRNKLNIAFRNTANDWSQIQVEPFNVTLPAGDHDLTGLILNPNADKGLDDWTTSSCSTSSSEHWSGESNPYFTMGYSSSSSWTATMSQDIPALPTGLYSLTFYARASADATVSVTVGNKTIQVPGIGNTGGEGFGWRPFTISFEGNGQPFSILFEASATSSNQWAHLDALTLTTTIEDETTGISNAIVEKKSADNWYTLDGKKVAQPSKKGIYINNGNKVIIK